MGDKPQLAHDNPDAMRLVRAREQVSRLEGALRLAIGGASTSMSDASTVVELVEEVRHLHIEYRRIRLELESKYTLPRAPWNPSDFLRFEGVDQ